MRKSYTDMQFAVTSLKMLKLSACLYLDFYKKYCFTDLLIFFGGEGENCYISNYLLFLSFSVFFLKKSEVTVTILDG